MQESEIIKTPLINPKVYETIVEESVKYAIISFAFTIDRMKIPDPSQRVLNIAKGKIAEGLFRYFCEQNDISIDFDSCQTEYWQTDNRDFLFQDYEWDLKNNFIYLNNNEEFNSYTKLPALIPNKSDKDQWSTRKINKIDSSKGVNYLFSFLKGAELINNNRKDFFLTLCLSSRQKKMLSLLYDKYKGIPSDKKPFNNDKFWHEFSKGNAKFYKLNSMPNLIIAGYAEKEQWDLFKDTGPFSEDNYINYYDDFWYTKVGQYKSLKWLNGAIWTRITNKTLPVELLKPFADFLEKN